MKRYFLIGLLTLSCLSGFSQNKQYKKLAKLGSDDFYESVLYELETPRQIVIKQVRINGSEKTYNLVFDTGSTSCHIGPELAKELDVPVAFRDSVWDGYSSRLENFGLVDFSISGVNFNQIVTGLNFQPMEVFDDIDGIIGFNLIRQCAWKLNLFDEEIVITDDVDNFADQDEYYQQYLLILNGGVPYVSCGYEHVRGTALFDMGDNAVYTTEVTTPWNKNYAEMLTGKGVGLSSSFGTIMDTSITVEKLRYSWFNFGKFNFFPWFYPKKHKRLKIENIGVRNVVVKLIADNGDYHAVGAGMLDYYSFIIDAPKNRFYSKPHVVGKRIPFRSFGLGAMPYNGKYVVAVVWDRSDAKSAGIRPGDEFLQIADLDLRKLSEKPVSEIYPQIDKVLKGDEPIEVTVKSRNGKIVTAVLHKRVLL